MESLVSKRLWKTLPALALTMLIGLSGCFYSKPSRSPTMDTSGWITHCYGRFLIDLPPHTVIHGAGYYLWGDKIERMDETPESLTALIDQREQELKAQQHQKIQGSMFLRHIDLGGSSTGLLSWDSDYSVKGLILDTYAVTQPHWRAYRWKGEISPSKEQGGIEVATDLARNIRSRGPGEIPTEPGFCIEDGYIAGSEYQSEDFEMGFSFPEHPGANFAFSSYTGASETHLIERGDSFLLGAAKLVIGIDTLRKGRHDIGPIQAEEYNVAGSEKDQRAYAFKWESYGQESSIEHPTLTMEMGVLERRRDHHGNPPPPAFESDQQALDLWDAIIASIRLRPGAVGTSSNR